LGGDSLAKTSGCDCLSVKASVMGLCCSRAAVLSDAKFTVRLPPEQALEYLATPENWLNLIPGCSGGIAQWEDSAERHFSILSVTGAKTTYGFHFTNVTRERKALSYELFVGRDARKPSAKFCARYTFSHPAGDNVGGCLIHRRATRYRQMRKLHLPFRPFVRAAMRKENDAMQRLMSLSAPGAAL
jgi:hypothetical protein